MLVVMCQQWNPDRKLHSGYVKNYQLSIIMITLFYRMKRSWGKVIFSEECVKNSVHRGDRSHGTPPRQAHPPGRYTPAGRYTPQAGTPPRQVHPQAGTPPRQVHPLVNEQAVRILLECILVPFPFACRMLFLFVRLVCMSQ